MHPKAISASWVVSVMFGSVAAAQEPPTTTTVSNSGGVSGSPSPNNGGGGGDAVGTAFGVGAQALLTGPVGPALVYNMTRFHIEGMFAFSDIANANSFTIAGRAWLHIHNSPNASLSLGGGGGLQSVERPAMMGTMSTKDSNLLLEGGAQIRFFATRNVAISASAGLALVTGDGDSTAVTGQVTGAFGITYFLY